MPSTDKPVLSGNVLHFFDRFSAKALVLLSVALFIIFGWLWWRNIHNDPTRVFNGMLENSLRLKGVTRHVTQTGLGQDVSQWTQLNLGAVQKAESRTELTQTGDIEAEVETQSIGTPYEDFVRYTSIETSQTGADGQKLDFSTILNIWGSNNATPEAGTTNGELYNESVLGVIPIGSLSVTDRATLLRYIRSNTVYEVDYTALERELIDGRPVYTYPVKVDAEKYVTMLKEFARMVGLNHLENVDPAAYGGSEKLEFSLSVDVWARQLVRIRFGSDDQRIEELSGHNVVKSVGLPEETITVDELQGRLQEIQQ